METYDYIVVGSGSAGSVVASRLSEDASMRVLLIEAGPPPGSFWIGTPAGMAKLFLHQRYNWNFFTEPVETLNGRKIYWPRGKTLGGSSALNGMIYMRGHPLDYDHWESLGIDGWGWKSVLPYFKRSEANQRGGSEQHGHDGPWYVSDPVVRHPSSDAFIQAAIRNGINRNDDLNGPPYEGVGYQQFNILNGRRHSAYDAFVAPVRHRRNLVIATDTRVLKVLFDGSQARGVEVLHRGSRRSVAAAREVILCAGAVNSPQLLMLSGIGPAAHLQQCGITVRVDAADVGRNLQDHWNSPLVYRSTPEGSYNHELNGWRKYAQGARYMLTRGGYLALGGSPLSAYVKSGPECAQPDLQLVSRAMTFTFGPDGTAKIDRVPGISAAVVLLQPRSRGLLQLRSADPLQPPVVSPDYLAKSEDGRRIVAGIRLMRKIFNTEPMASRILDEELPGLERTRDEDLLEHVKNHGGTSWHPVGTCRMGADENSVVDPSLCVRGVDRLRVVDASVMPRITSGNTAAPAVMIGEKGADLIRQSARAST